MAVFGIGHAICVASIFTVLVGAFVAEALQVAVNSRVIIQTAPLVEGPSWLPVHCKVVVDDSYVFDFIPLNAASKETLQKLVTLQAVPATVRILKKNAENEDDGKSNRVGEDAGKSASAEQYVERAVLFSEEYDRDLHLLSNNCWSFAFDLLQTISRPENARGEL